MGSSRLLPPPGRWQALGRVSGCLRGPTLVTKTIHLHLLVDGPFSLVDDGCTVTMNLNLSASLNIFKLISNPSLCLPHAIIPTFRDLPTPLDSALEKGHGKVRIEAVVLDKDDCFAVPETNEVYGPYKVSQISSHSAVYP